MENSTHTDLASVMLPLAGVLLGVLMALVRQFEPGLRPVVSFLIWLVTTGVSFYWLRAEVSRGNPVSKWFFLVLGVPLVQLLALAFHLVRTRPFPRSIASVLQLLVLAAGYFGFYLGAVNVTLHVLA
ncbi:hypothetical protein [Nevskia sp.]|uniref:hypothetical protein n=1 Tax=Nevskia sp. TaxID=1929292 RepID=UPI0025D35A46|nr:hypothetical protein [Nevskia sp.]